MKETIALESRPLTEKETDESQEPGGPAELCSCSHRGEEIDIYTLLLATASAASASTQLAEAMKCPGALLQTLQAGVVAFLSQASQNEPVIHPEILVKSSSITPGWCNITLECDVPGNREDLSVTWESTGLPRELEWSGTPELAPNTWELTVNLSLIQSSATLTCVVSNHVEKKTASVDFAQVCSHEPVIIPEILVKSSSITPGWCNITLECKAPGIRENLSVTWESKGLPRELEWSGTPELAPNAWKLTVNKSLIQTSANLTCVVSNHVEKKTASVDFAQVCSHGHLIGLGPSAPV
ncbi:hypothetical protein Celaphus_00001870 [Cervus elaphus hippelaphus]|uniref:Ig-like domain-containing protein n=1 Tax=Cervus elaphus hippelaphus TaxID=46360 RepID=A0A212CFU0_CEREH|nr:hypothetical protein Celaphus_00001870 [Cervus elaphus hippelaphus]